MRQAKSTSRYLLLLASLFLAAGSAPAVSQTGVTVFEGARLITGEGTAIESSAFMVENGRFTGVGRRGELTVPAGAAHVDLTGNNFIAVKKPDGAAVDYAVSVDVTAPQLDLVKNWSLRQVHVHVDRPYGGGSGSASGPAWTH